MSDVVRLSDYESSEIFKSFIVKGVEGKVPIRKVVTRRGKTFSQTYWVKPKDFKAFKSTEHAAEFLTRTVDAFNHFSGILTNLSKYNEELAAKVYEEMKKAGQSQIELAGRMVQLAEWSGRRESNISDLLTALHVKSQGGKKTLDWKDIEEAYAQISYKYDNSGLAIGGEKETKIKVTSELNPENWSEKVGGVAKVIQDVVKRAYGRVKEIFEKRGIKLEESSEGTELNVEAKKVEEKPASEEKKEKPVKEKVKTKEEAKVNLRVTQKDSELQSAIDEAVSKLSEGKSFGRFVAGGKKYYYNINEHANNRVFNSTDLMRFKRDLESGRTDGAIYVLKNGLYAVILSKDVDKIKTLTLKTFRDTVDRGVLSRKLEGTELLSEYKKALESLGFDVEIGKTKEVM